MKDTFPIYINGFDLSIDKHDGIHRNCLEILNAMDEQLSLDGQALSIKVIVPELNSLVPRYKNIGVVNLEKGHQSLWDRIRWRAFSFPQFVQHSNALGLDMTLGFPLYGNMCVFDYDCIKEKYPNSYFNTFVKTRVWYYQKRVKKSLSNARLVFTDSEFAKSEISTLYGIDSTKVRVIPCAWQHMLRIQQDDGIVSHLGLKQSNYFFSLGSRFPYKNIRWVVAAARQNPQYHFVVTGSEQNVRDVDEGDAPSNLTFTGYLSDEEVKGLEAHCRAFLHPSLAEGFGIPPMEAMSAGARCVVSNATSLPEVYGDSVWYIDPTDYDHIDLDEIMSRSLAGTNEDVLSRYSWKRSAQMLLDELEGVARGA